MIAVIIEGLLAEETTRGLAEKSHKELAKNLKSFALCCEDKQRQTCCITPQHLLD